MSAVMTKAIKDSNGVEVREGDVIHFSYGIPPRGVRAPVILRDGRLIAITTGHNPAECPVSKIMGHVGAFWVERKTPQKGTKCGE